MCGYCFEGGVLIPALELAYKGEKTKIDGFNIENYLQEESNLYLVVDEAKKFECRNDYAGIILCRLYEKYILSGVDNVLYKKITSIFGDDIVNTVLKKSSLDSKQYVSRIRKKLSDKEIYQNNRQWDNCISGKPELIEDSLNLLNFYYDWWIKGQNKRKSDSLLRLKKTGIMDPIANTPKTEWERFYALFPLVYFSLTYLWKYHSDTELIEKIALHCPDGTPDFGGYDLWLQRKAFVFFIQKVGIVKALEKIDQVRIELIYYTLLKTNFEIAELEIIKKVVVSFEKNHVVSSCEYEDVLSIIDDLILVKGKIDNLNTLYPTIPSQTLKEYHCPHCNKFLFKGNVQKLNMVCSHCQKMIIPDGNEF
ncbi:hypothetical protein [Desulfobacula sp.]|uniref:hypothetical protein n=1 Tax=Desulfobacula sp. TaxID=2593537 RepID=UPI0025C052D4|nr:hypothetical protein [Desulfobacula sp.]MBC2704290.1 hypothetical protein [Desulfobacula sp.]